MAFICEDVGTTKRRKMTKTRALRRWEAHKGICVNCKMPIDAAREDWFIEHIRALELGGEDTDENTGPAHTACKKDKDAADHKAAAKAKRQKQQLLGIKDPNRKKIPQPPRAPKRPSKPPLPPRNLFAPVKAAS
jgi:5-methylcytosine-specific restriction protein A